VLSPMMTVFVLAVLWLIVVVPMLFRRHDERRRERSVDGFGRSMRALGRRAPASDARTEVFVPSARRAEDTAVSTRRPVPAAQEALMYPVDRSEMSEARAQMMARRRRSLGILGAGTVVLAPTAFLVGGLMWLVAAPFAIGLVGYMLFLRSQAQRDRDRRHNRQQRAAQRRTRSVDMTAAAPAPAPQAPAQAESVVRIDDDDIELHNLDTVDLTGLYNDQIAEAAAQRRAS
jgi:membrane protein implicated in regulation of membrane protease activity